MKEYKYRKYFTVEGKRYSVYGNTEEECIIKKTEKLRDIREGKIISATMSVEAWTKRCLDVYKPNVSKRYRDEMDMRINKHILSQIGSLPVRSIKPMMCQEILNNQIGMSKSHITKLTQELKFIFEKAVENQLILQNPAKNVIKPQGTKGHRRSLTKKEMEHFVSVCKLDRRFLLFELMLYCGCRPSEAMNVQGRDIMELENIPTLHIRGTKTENADRYVPIPLELYHRIKGTDSFSFVALNTKGNKHSTSSYKRLTESLRRALNISMGARTYRNKILPPYPLAEDFTPYILRHTYCTNLQKMGVDVRAAQRLMGHADIRTTSNIYTHQDNETFIQAADQMGIKRIG